VSDVNQVIADLEAGLAAARELAAAQTAQQTVAGAGEGADTSGMPGGVDSAPVSVDSAPVKPDTESLLEKVEDTAEIDAVDIIGELKSGSSISDVANKLLDQNGLSSIVKAIGTLAERIL
jgi:hypothetical protein